MLIVMTNVITTLFSSSDTRNKSLPSVPLVVPKKSPLAQLVARTMRIPPVSLLFCITSFSFLTLHGCNLPSWINARSEILTDKVESALVRSSNGNRTPLLNLALTKESLGSWLGTHVPIRTLEAPKIIPEALLPIIDITYVEPVSLNEIGRLIASKTGISISVDPDIQSTTLTNLNFSGPASAALDYLASQLGFSWRVRNSTVEIFHTDLETWVIYTPIVSSQWKASVGLSGSVQGGGGGSDLQARDQVVVSMDTAEFWSQLETTITGLLSSAGRLTLNRQSGELTVIDTPRSLMRVDEWIIGKNQELATQVVVYVDLYEIERNEDAISGFNFQGIVQEALGSSAAAIEFDSDDTGALFGLRLTHSPQNVIDQTDISLILRKASGDGHVAKLTSTVLRGMNGHPVPVFFGDETSYLQRRDVVTDEGLTTVRLVPGKLQDGIALNMIPRVLPNTDRLLLNITVRTTRIKGISRFPADAGPNDPVIQLPDLESRSVLLPVMLRSGETLFVAGLDTARTTGSHSNGIFSKESKTQNRRASLVLLITPHIIHPPLEIAGFKKPRRFR